ncbi:hypothetical protein HWV62_43060 [Athelia sp. TMB]|nr:hypothetical protein HWV62_43060 [Athelia sp. TMB]
MTAIPGDFIYDICAAPQSICLTGTHVIGGSITVYSVADATADNYQYKVVCASQSNISWILGQLGAAYPSTSSTQPTATATGSSSGTPSTTMSSATATGSNSASGGGGLAESDKITLGTSIGLGIPALIFTIWGVCIAYKTYVQGKGK